MPLDLVLASPFQDRPTGELGSVIADNASRFAIESHLRIEFPCHAGARDAGVGHQTQVLAAAIIIDGQNPELAGYAEGVGHKVHRPACARDQRHGHGGAATTRPFPTPTATNRQTFLPVNPVELLVIHDQPLAFEHYAYPAIAKAAALARDLTHGNTDGTMVWRAFAPGSALGHAPGMAAACALGIDTNQHAGPALGDLETSQHFEHSITPLAWRRQAFPSRFFRMTLSSILSASKRFSLPFSSSS